MTEELPLLAAVCIAASCCASGGVHRSASAIHALPDAREGEPVALSGVVTYAPHERNSFVVADISSATNAPPVPGVYIRARGAAAHPQLDVGDEIDILGFTEMGRFAMSVAATNITLRRPGPSRLPPPVTTTASDIFTGRYDCYRVVVEGTVANARANGGVNGRETQLLVRTISGETIVFINAATPSAELARFVDCGVRVTGVVFPILNARDEIVGSRIACNSLADVEIVQHAPPTAFDAVPLDPHRLSPITPNGAILTRRTARARVSACTPHGFYCLLDGDIPLRVTVEDDSRPAPGEEVELSGYMTGRNLLVAMEHTIWRSVAEADSTRSPLPKPKPLTHSDIFPDTPNGRHPDFDGRIVTITGSITMNGVNSDGHPFIVVDLDGYPAVALAPNGVDLSGFKPGSRVSVTGVAVMSFEGNFPALDNLRVTGFRLALRDSGDVVVLSRPPWWTPGRLFALIGILLAAIGIILIRNLRLKRIVERRTAQLFAQHRHTLELQTRTDERARLATDLHDSLEQELTGTALQLDAAHIALERNPALLPAKLDLARSQLAETRAELHRTVWGLRDPLIREGRLVDALRRKYGDGAGASTSPRIVISAPADFPRLPGYVAYHLFHSVSEAVTNALKHAQAHTVAIDINHLADEKLVAVSVTDDGVGFDVSSAPGPDQGHFGLQGMRERMARIHGACSISSQRGCSRLTFNAPATAER